MKLLKIILGEDGYFFAKVKPGGFNFRYGWMTPKPTTSGWANSV